MRDLPADPQYRAPDGDLRASGGSYTHKGMHMTWMEKVRKRAQKPVKTGQKREKTPKKVKIRASPS